MTLRCVAIDDEPLARECIANYVREIDFLQLTGAGNNPIELTRLLNEQKVDLILNELYPGENRGVPDPWFGAEDGYHKVFDMLDKACDKIIERYGRE